MTIEDAYEATYPRSQRDPAIMAEIAEKRERAGLFRAAGDYAAAGVLDRDIAALWCYSHNKAAYELLRKHNPVAAAKLALRLSSR